MSALVIGIVLLVSLPIIALALALIFGGPHSLPPMDSINAPFSRVDYTSLPPLQTYMARDGAALGYRSYNPVVSGSLDYIVLVHGSASRSDSMHVLGKALAVAGYRVYALDMRGHGKSGMKGDIQYVGQLEDDIEDFILSVQPEGSGTMIGFSAGGGFALRLAGSHRQNLFDRYLLLSPFIHYTALTYRPGNGGWADVGVPRFIALMILDRLGIRWFEHLPVIAFAMNAEEKRVLTPTYSFTLFRNFKPPDDFAACIRSVRRPLKVLVGEKDEVFYAKQFRPTFSAAGRDIPVVVVPGVDHAGLVLARAAVAEVISMLHR